VLPSLKRKLKREALWIPKIIGRKMLSQTLPKQYRPLRAYKFKKMWDVEESDFSFSRLSFSFISAFFTSE
jgi:hypothetical protein